MEVLDLQNARNNSGLGITLPESDAAPENRPLEKEIPIGNHNFQVLC